MSVYVSPQSSYSRGRGIRAKYQIFGILWQISDPAFQIVLVYQAFWKPFAVKPRDLSLANFHPNA